MSGFDTWGAPKRPLSQTEKPAEKADLKSVSGGGQVSQDEGQVWFYKDVSQSSIAELVLGLHKAGQDRQVKAIQFSLGDPPPLHLHIHSYGGSVFAGFAAADAVRRCSVPVHTHIEGGAASAATLFSVMGKHRTIGANSFILIHQLSNAFWGKYEEFKDEMKNNDALMEQIRAIYEQRTKLTRTKLDEILKRDLWFNAKQALKAGLVDEIL